MKTEEHRCRRIVYGASRGMPSHQCPWKGIVERNGKWYCARHDPVAIEEKRKAEGRKWALEAEETRRAELYPDLLAALPDPERLREIAAMLFTWPLHRGNANLLCDYADRAEKAISAAKGGAS